MSMKKKWICVCKDFVTNFSPSIVVRGLRAPQLLRGVMAFIPLIGTTMVTGIFCQKLYTPSYHISLDFFPEMTIMVIKWSAWNRE